ncbi:MAG TPA: MFS transporter [Candidatus Limnocylindria bacterium]|nr:MFS transporter [Candidatus Limnocylindria bacterium]
MTDATQPTGPRPMGVRDVLRIPVYRRLIAGQAVSDIGDGITLLMLLLVINDLTGSSTALALMAISEAVPHFTIGLFAGVYVDRWNRRSVMLAADLLRAGIVLSFAAVATAGILPLLYLLAFLQSSVATFFRPARGALLPRIVPPEGLPAANSLAQGSQLIGTVVGAGIAGLLFGQFGSSVAGFAIDSATFLVSFAFISRIPSALGRISAAADGEDEARAPVLRSMLEGLAIVRGSRLLAGSVIAAAVTMLGLGAVNVLFVPLIVRELRVDPTWMAGLDFAQTSSMLMAAGIVTLLVRRLAPTTIISICLAGLGVFIGLLAGVSAIWQVLLILFAVGWMVTPLQAMLQTIVQTTATDATRGRVVSLLQASLSTASVASMAVGGVLGDLIGTRQVFVAASVVVIGAALLSVVLFRGVGVGTRPVPATPAT